MPLNLFHATEDHEAKGGHENGLQLAQVQIRMMPLCFLPHWQPRDPGESGMVAAWKLTRKEQNSRCQA